MTNYAQSAVLFNWTYFQLSAIKILDLFRIVFERECAYQTLRFRVLGSGLGFGRECLVFGFLFIGLFWEVCKGVFMSSLHGSQVLAGM